MCDNDLQSMKYSILLYFLRADFGASAKAFESKVVKKTLAH